MTDPIDPVRQLIAGIEEGLFDDAFAEITMAVILRRDRLRRRRTEADFPIGTKVYVNENGPKYLRELPGVVVQADHSCSIYDERAHGVVAVPCFHPFGLAATLQILSDGRFNVPVEVGQG